MSTGESNIVDEFIGECMWATQTHVRSVVDAVLDTVNPPAKPTFMSIPHRVPPTTALLESKDENRRLLQHRLAGHTVSSYTKRGFAEANKYVKVISPRRAQAQAIADRLAREVKVAEEKMEEKREEKQDLDSLPDCDKTDVSVYSESKLFDPAFDPHPTFSPASPSYVPLTSVRFTPQKNVEEKSIENAHLPSAKGVEAAPSIYGNPRCDIHTNLNDSYEAHSVHSGVPPEALVLGKPPAVIEQEEYLRQQCERGITIPPSYLGNKVEVGVFKGWLIGKTFGFIMRLGGANDIYVSQNRCLDEIGPRSKVQFLIGRRQDGKAFAYDVILYGAPSAEEVRAGSVHMAIDEISEHKSESENEAFVRSVLEKNPHLKLRDNAGARSVYSPTEVAARIERLPSSLGFLPNPWAVPVVAPNSFHGSLSSNHTRSSSDQPIIRARSRTSADRKATRPEDWRKSMEKKVKEIEEMEEDDDPQYKGHSFEEAKQKGGDLPTEPGSVANDWHEFIFPDMNRVHELRPFMKPGTNHYTLSLDETYKFPYKAFWGNNPTYHKKKNVGKRFAIYARNDCAFPNVAVALYGITWDELARCNQYLSMKRTAKNGIIAPAIAIGVFRQAIRDSGVWAQHAMDHYFESTVRGLVNTFRKVNRGDLNEMAMLGGQTSNDTIDAIQGFIRGAIGLPTSIRQSFMEVCSAAKGVKDTVLEARDMCAPQPIVEDKEAEELAVEVELPAKKRGSTVRDAFQINEPRSVKLYPLMPYVPCDLSFPLETVGNLDRAMQIRQMKETPTANPSKLQHMNTVTKLISRFLFKPIDMEQTFDTWFNSRSWSKGKKLRYMKEFDGTTDDSTTRSTFIKRELCLSGKEKAARIIGASKSDIQMYYGPITDTVKSAMARQTFDQNVVFTSGLNRLELGALLENHRGLVGENAVHMSSDFSKFDSTICKSHMDCEETILKRFVPNFSTDVHNLIARNKRNLKFKSAMNGIEYRAYCATSRASGDPDTTIGNSAICLSYWYAMMHLIGAVKVETSRERVTVTAPIYIMVCGDDSFITTTPEWAAKLSQAVQLTEEYGFRLELTPPVADPCQAEYLSGMFIRARVVGDVNGVKTDKVTYVHAAKVSRVLCKTPWTHKDKLTAVERDHLAMEKLSAMADNLWYLPETASAMRETFAMFRKSYKSYHLKKDELSYILRGPAKFYNCAETMEDLQTRYPGLIDLDPILARKFAPAALLQGKFVPHQLDFEALFDFLDVDGVPQRSE
jgi:hypothetical protein